MFRLESRPGLPYCDKIEGFKPETELIKRAFEYGREKHRGQIRDEGTEYFTHCVAVASILQSWGVTDEKIIVAALLHDVVEDCDVTLEEIAVLFGADVSRWVDGVSKLKSEGPRKEVDTQRKIVERGFFEPQVTLIKLADRLHNMKTLGAVSPEKQRRKASETLDIYAPLAESLGMWRVKTELEDLSFPYIFPERYQEVRTAIDRDPRLQEMVLANMESRLGGLLEEIGLSGRVEVRLKGYYEADKKRERLAKSQRGDGSLVTISDLVSFRVILDEQQPNWAGVDPVLACYTFMGQVHQTFRESVDVNRFDDFLVSPATNGYQALQTTVRLPQGSVEIAITTSQLEDFNHWGIVSKIRAGETDLRDYVQKVVFTPSLKIKFLEKTATGWDYAYRISPLLGARAAELEVNGERTPMSTVLPNAAVVKVILGKNLAPGNDDLNYASRKTRALMETQLALTESQKSIATGRRLLEPLLAQFGLVDLEDLSALNGRQESNLSPPLAALLVEFGCTSIEGLYLQLGHGRIGPAEVVSALTSLGVTREQLNWSTIRVTGPDQPGVLAEFSSLLSEMGKNIISVHTRTARTRFELRLVATDLGPEDRQLIASRFQTDPRFETFVIV